MDGPHSNRFKKWATKTWYAIEQARTDFYRTYYTALFTAIKNSSLPEKALFIMFNEQGLIPASEQHWPLPAPTALY